MADMQVQIDTLRSELASRDAHGGGAMAHHVPTQGLPPQRVVQHPPDVAFRVDNAGSKGVNGFYKKDGACHAFLQATSCGTMCGRLCLRAYVS